MHVLLDHRSEAILVFPWSSVYNHLPSASSHLLNSAKAGFACPIDCLSPFVTAVKPPSRVSIREARSCSLSSIEAPLLACTATFCSSRSYFHALPVIVEVPFSSLDLPSLIPEILFLVEQICPRTTQIYNLRAPVSVLLQSCALEAVEGV